MIHVLGKVTEPCQSVKWGQRRLKLILEFKKVKVLEKRENPLQVEGKQMPVLGVEEAGRG